MFEKERACLGERLLDIDCWQCVLGDCEEVYMVPGRAYKVTGLTFIFTHVFSATFTKL